MLKTQPVERPASNTPWEPSRMASIPLVVAYLALPLSAVLLRQMGPGPMASPFLPWLILAGLGTIWAMLFRRSGVPVQKRFFVEACAFLALAAMLFLRQEIFLRQMELFLPIIVEIAPIGVIGFCLMWTMTFGVPDRAAFQRFGNALAVLCIVDLAVGLVIHHAVPVQRWLGNGDILAGLLLVSLCASLSHDNNDGNGIEPDRSGLGQALVLLGLVACMSRTGLFGAGWIFLCFGRGSKLMRGLVALVFFLLICLTFLFPTIQPRGADYIEYWLWAKSVGLLFREPSLLITGLPVNLTLPFPIPPELGPLWERFTASPALMGPHIPQIKSFWLRSILGWGALLPMAGLTALFFLLSRRMTRMGAGLMAALFAQGMSTPLFHDPSLGAVFGLAFILALSKPAPLPEAKPDPDTHDLEPDPAREWDMRPL